MLFFFFFFFFKQKTAYEIMPSLVGSEMCIRDRCRAVARGVAPVTRDAAARATSRSGPRPRTARVPGPPARPALRRHRGAPRARHGGADELRYRVPVRAPGGLRALGAPVRAPVRHERRCPRGAVS